MSRADHASFTASNIQSEREMKHDYSATLRELQTELDGIDQRRSDLEAAIEALKRLVSPEEHAAVGNGNGTKPKLAIPRGFFSGKKPTQAYRDFSRLWGTDHTPPEIADAFIAGGMTDKSKSELVQAIHSVRKREKQRTKREQPDLELEGDV